ncbi:G-protein coupled receptor 39 [Galemys pyrenaicus]|uniref:G-protein coupled receptor 39 n=1 Tax=Galemys pyrenaicus TaxID=202257 RepID=A0A8J6DRG2_GALPY|nr:G-protein coupled receptor 39 [Galemys pyrenaicus]
MAKEIPRKLKTVTRLMVPPPSEAHASCCLPELTYHLRQEQWLLFNSSNYGLCSLTWALSRAWKGLLCISCLCGFPLAIAVCLGSAHGYTALSELRLEDVQVSDLWDQIALGAISVSGRRVVVVAEMMLMELKEMDVVGVDVIMDMGMVEAGLIVVTLAVCWMPNQVRRIMAAAKPKSDWTKPYFKAYMLLLPFSDTFFYLSSVINPLLYNVSSRQFRRVFVQVLRCHLTLQHANKEKQQRAASLGTSTRSVRRPLLFVASRRNSSARRTNKIFLSTFQGEAKPESQPQQQNPESPAPNFEVKLENGLQEIEV